MTWQPDLCIYHGGGCLDGFGAAWAIWRRWPQCRFLPGVYGQPLPAVADLNVLFVDYSASRETLEAMAQDARSVIVIDHHKSAMVELAPFALGFTEGAVLTPEAAAAILTDLAALQRPPILAWFDLNQSGATMAWQFAVGTDRRTDPCPELLNLIEDYDLWHFAQGERTRQLMASLRAYPLDFECWDGLASEVDRLADEGAIILRGHRAQVASLVQEVYFDGVGGHHVPVVNASAAFASDVGHELLARFPEAPFVATWFRRSDSVNQWSLRSEDSRVDVSEIARAFGGGGHRNAAGFQTPA